MALSDETLKKLDKLYPLSVQQYEPFVPEEQNANFIERLNKVIAYMNKVGLLNNQVVMQWNLVMKWILDSGLEELTEEYVNKRVEELLDLDEFAGIVQEALQGIEEQVDAALVTLTNSVNDTLTEKQNEIDAMFTDYAAEIDTTLATYMTETSETVQDLEGIISKNEYNQYNAVVEGALPNNVFDSYNALEQTFLKASQDTVYDLNVSSNRIITKKIVIPQGVYRVKEPDVLKNLSTIRSQNLVIDGSGSTIIFEGFEGNCFYFRDNLLNIDFYNVNFASISDSTADNRILFKSLSHGGTQSVRFHQCTFRGKMKYAFDLIGSNVNSEMVFNDCGMFGQWESFLYIGSSNTSDQFLNYWFNNCRYWCSSNFITAYKGGHFKLNHCDISGFQPTANTYLFRLLGGAHAWGVTTFIDDGSRYELKTSQAKVMFCEWDLARISFENCDMGSNQPNEVERADVFHFINNTLGDSSNYTFKNCTLQGKFKLQNNNVSPRNTVYFDECLLLGDSTTATIQDVFTFQKGVNAAEFFKVNLSKTKFKNKIFNTILNRLQTSDTFLKSTTKYMQNSSGLLNVWEYEIQDSAILDEIYVVTRHRSDGNEYQIAIKSDTNAKVSSVDTANSVVTDINAEIYIGNKITIGTSNTVYTVTNYDYSNRRLTTDIPIEGGVSTGAIIEFSIVNVTFTPTRTPRQIRSDSKYVLKNKLYMKSFGTTIPAAGIPIRVFPKVLE